MPPDQIVNQDKKAAWLRRILFFILILLIFFILIYFLLPISLKDKLAQQLSLVIGISSTHRLCTNTEGDKGYLLNGGTSIVFKDRANKTLICAKSSSTDTSSATISISAIDPTSFVPQPLTLTPASARSVFETFSTKLTATPFTCTNVSSLDSQVRSYLNLCN